MRELVTRVFPFFIFRLQPILGIWEHPGTTPAQAIFPIGSMCP